VGGHAAVDKESENFVAPLQRMLRECINVTVDLHTVV